MVLHRVEDQVLQDLLLQETTIEIAVRLEEIATEVQDLPLVETIGQAIVDQDQIDLQEPLVLLRDLQDQAVQDRVLLDLQDQVALDPAHRDLQDLLVAHEVDQEEVDKIHFNTIK